MSPLIEDLLSLQKLVKLGATASADQTAEIARLRAAIPESVACHFFRQVANGRRGIAVVRNGVCGECHIRLSHAMVHMLGRSNDLLLCENCGSFVTLSPEDRSALAARSAAKPRTRKPRALAA